MATLYDITKQDIEDVIDCLFEGIKSDSDSIDRLNKINESSAALAVSKNRNKKLIVLSKFRSILAELYIVSKEELDEEIRKKAYSEMLEKNSDKNLLQNEINLQFLDSEEIKMIDEVDVNDKILKKIEKKLEE